VSVELKGLGGAAYFITAFCARSARQLIAVFDANAWSCQAFVCARSLTVTTAVALVAGSSLLHVLVSGITVALVLSALVSCFLLATLVAFGSLSSLIALVSLVTTVSLVALIPVVFCHN
jgi:hypothetical protein